MALLTVGGTVTSRGLQTWASWRRLRRHLLRAAHRLSFVNHPILIRKKRIAASRLRHQRHLEVLPVRRSDNCKLIVSYRCRAAVALADLDCFFLGHRAML